MTRKRILIIDDEKAIREILRDFFEIEGFEVFEAADGASALETARKESFDVVLTDLTMPPPDGFVVLEEIRRIRPGTVVLMMTACRYPEKAIRALELGCDGYVTKPFDLEQLKDAVDQGLIKREWDREHPDS